MALAVAACPVLAAEPATPPATPPASSTPAKPDVLFTDTVLVKGKGFEIKRSELDAEVIRYKATAAAQPGAPVPPDVDVRLLDKMIQIQLVLSKATQEDRAKGKKEFETYLERVKKSAKLTDEEFYQKLGQQLRSTGQTRDQWEKQNIDQATLPMVLQHEIKTNPTEEQAKKYYDEHLSSFEEPEKVRVSHILISTKDSVTGADVSAAKRAEKRKQMDDILKRARAGEDWAKLVKEYSEDPGSKTTGGEYTFPRNRMVPEFETAAFALTATNQISEVVTTSYGFHIIKLLEHFPARKEQYVGLDTKTVLVKTDGNKAIIREILSDDEVQKELPNYIQKLRKESTVEILDDAYKIKEPSDLSAKPDETTPPKPAKK